MKQFYWNLSLPSFRTQPSELDQSVEEYLVQTYDSLVKRALIVKGNVTPQNLETSILEMLNLESLFSELIFYYTCGDVFTVEEIERALDNEYALTDYLSLFDSDYYGYLSHSIIPLKNRKR